SRAVFPLFLGLALSNKAFNSTSPPSSLLPLFPALRPPVGNPSHNGSAAHAEGSAVSSGKPQGAPALLAPLRAGFWKSLRPSADRPPPGAAFSPRCAHRWEILSLRQRRPCRNFCNFPRQAAGRVALLAHTQSGLL